MTITHKGVSYTLPEQLADISLSQWVGFYEQYGNKLDARYAEIQLMEEGQKRADAYFLYDVDLALQTFSYYTGIPLFDVMTDMAPKDVIVQANLAMVQWKQQEQDITINKDYIFQFDTKLWSIEPLFASKDNTSYNEFKEMQDIALVFADLQEGRAEALYELCAAFLRKLEEEYSPQLIQSGSNRIELMKQLPLNIALQVKKYVEKSIDIFINATGK